MPRNQKSAVIVAIFLGTLIILPLIIWTISRLGDSSTQASGSEPSGHDSRSITEIPDFDIRQLAEKVESLLQNELADAVRQGDIPLELIADLKRLAERARSDMRSGKVERAETGYKKVLSAASAQLEALEMANIARALNESTYSELKRLESLKVAFENTYREAVETYNSALGALNAGEFQKSVDEYEVANAILSGLEARSIQQISDILETAQIAIEAYRMQAAKLAYQEVLRIDEGNTEATEGLVMVQALEGIADEVKAIKALDDAGEFDAALKQIDSLLAERPNHPILQNQRNAFEAKILERDYQALLARVDAAEAIPDYPVAIKALEDAIALRENAEQLARLAALKAKYIAIRLEELLEAGFAALKAGSYENARDIYKQAVALDANSKEARNGLEKASNLYIANIRYSQNIANANKFVREGRYPMAAKFFNDAMSSRPSKVPAVQVAEEKRIRETLEAQSNQVTIFIESDKRTYVSIIGILPPDRFKETDLKLYPDVYKVKGTRAGFKTVEFELKVDANKPNQTIHVECTEKR